MVAAIVAIMVVAIVAAGSGSGETDVPAVSPTQVPTQDVTATSFLDVDTGVRTPNPAIAKGSANFYPVSPDGSMIAYSTFGPRDRVWVVNTDGTGKREITPPNLDGYAPSWSPDGSTLVFQGRDANVYNSREVGQLYLADVATGTLTRLTDLDPIQAGNWLVQAEISPDGSSVLFHLPNDSLSWDLWTVPITGGTPTLLRRDAGFGSYGPKGKIVFLDHPNDFTGDFTGTIWLMDADGRNARMLTQGSTYGWPEISPDGTRVAYDNIGTVYVIEIATGQTAAVGSGTQPAWFDNDTLIVD